MSHNKLQLEVKPNSHDIVVIREFEAPRELVFKAFTDPELYVKWLGPKGYKMDLVKFEPESGGSWRYIHTDLQGNQHGFHGVNHEVTAPERIIGTFEYEGLPEAGHVALDVSTFEELPGGRTRFTSRTVFSTVEDRDGMVASGMEEGMTQSYEALDELLLELNK